MNDYLIDSHCHLHDPQWFTTEQQESFLCQAAEDGVKEIICVGTDPKDSMAARDFAAKHAGVYWTYGIHPEFADRYARGESITPLLAREALSLSKDAGPRLPEKASFIASRGIKNSPLLVAIGEIGLDYHYDGYDRTAQIRLFEQMLQLAKDLDLPVSLHIREAFADAFAVLDNFSDMRGVVHSFTGSKKCLKQALQRGFHIGVNGLATYTTTPLPPIESMLLETDAPFLTPVPFRGTMNQPKYIRTIAEYLAGEMGVAEETIVEQTTKNARELFYLRGAET